MGQLSKHVFETNSDLYFHIWRKHRHMGRIRQQKSSSASPSPSVTNPLRSSYCKSFPPPHNLSLETPPPLKAPPRPRASLSCVASSALRSSVFALLLLALAFPRPRTCVYRTVDVFQVTRHTRGRVTPQPRSSSLTGDSVLPRQSPLSRGKHGLSSPLSQPLSRKSDCGYVTKHTTLKDTFENLLL